MDRSPERNARENEGTRAALPVASDWQWQGRLGRAGDPPNCASPFRGTAELATRSRSRFFLPTNHHPVLPERQLAVAAERRQKPCEAMAIGRIFNFLLL